MNLRRLNKAVVGAVVLAAAVAVTVLASSSPAATTAAAQAQATADDGVGLAPGKIKHVWLIILENKSYDASFTGLNNNTYLWQTLPSQGVLLKNYYGTGHFSLDNYISMVSGQATQADTQADCPFYDQFSGTVETSGSLKSNPNYGQLASAAGPNAAPGANGCVYPTSVQTLFDQLDAAHVSWKGYAQDLGTRRRRRATTRRACSTAGRRLRAPEPPEARRSRTRAARTRPISTCRSTSRSRGSRRSSSPATAPRRTSPTSSIRATACTTISRASRRRPRSAGSRRTTAATHTTPSATGTTSPAASAIRHDRMRRRTTAAGSTPPISSSSTSSRRSRRRPRSRTAA